MDSEIIEKINAIIINVYSGQKNEETEKQLEKLKQEIINKHEKKTRRPSKRR